MLSNQSLKDIESVVGTLKQIFVREVESGKINTDEDASTLAAMVMGAIQIKFAEEMAKAD